MWLFICICPWWVGNWFWQSWVGAILFCFLIIYDRARLTSKYLNTDEYILASVELYLDFINLFFYILSILGRK